MVFSCCYSYVAEYVYIGIYVCTYICSHLDTVFKTQNCSVFALSHSINHSSASPSGSLLDSDVQHIFKDKHFSGFSAPLVKFQCAEIAVPIHLV